LVLLSDLPSGLGGIRASIDILDPGSNPQSEAPQAGEVLQRRLLTKRLRQVMAPLLQCGDACIRNVGEAYRLAIPCYLVLMWVSLGAELKPQSAYLLT
jgi:hypothetical protein